MIGRQPTIEWQVAGACNYDCTYCIQSRKYRRGRPDADNLDGALGFFASLRDSWEIKCSGGEAFAHPLFMAKVVPGLMEATGHRISVLTNFSASRRTLMEFARLTCGRLRVFSASLHLEHADAAEFVAKARWFTNQLGDDASFVVNQVVLPGRESDAARCRDLVQEAGLRWFPQMYKVKGGVAEYPDEAALIALTGRAPTPRQANVAPSYYGQRCWAGVDYLVVDKDGDAWACRTGKRFGEGHLGNVFTGQIERFADASPCPYRICPCTVPANRGMIEGVDSSAASAAEGPIRLPKLVST